MDGLEAPLRAGFVIDALTPGAGTENQLLLLLRRFDRRRVIPYLCCLRADSSLPPLEFGGDVMVLGVHRLLGPEGVRGWLDVRGWIRGNGLDVVVTFFRDGNLLGTLGGAGTGVPVLSSRRNLGRGYWHNRWELWKLRRLNALTRGFIANSEAVRRYTARAEGVPLDRIEVIPNAVDTERFRPANPEERRRSRLPLGIPGPAVVAGCVANLRAIKGVDVLLGGWVRVAAARPDAFLVIAGDGPDRPSLEHYVREAGIADRVRFLGRRHDTPEILHACDLFVLPSRGESFSNALLEAMASGLPPVATAVGGNVELVDSAELGRIVPPEDPEGAAAAILELAGSETLRREIGERARARTLERHGIDRVLDRWTEVLHREAGRRAGRSGR